VKKPNLLCMRRFEHTNRLGVGSLQYTLQPFLGKYASASGDRHTLPIWPEPRMSCSPSPLEDKFRFVFREHIVWI
jgi:hypothetical protein